MADQWKVVEETPLNPEQIQQDPVAVPEWNVVEEVPLDLYAGDQNQGFLDRANQLFQEQLQPKEGFWPSFGKGLVRELPTMGMLAGGAVGAGAGGLGTAATLGAGSPMIPVLGVAGAGLGAGAGESLKQLIEQWTGISEPLGVEESLKRQGKAVLTGGMSQMAGEAGAKALAKGFGPWAEMFGEKIRSSPMVQQAQSMVEQGQALSPSSYQPTTTAKVLTWAVDNLVPGRQIANTYRSSLAEGIQKMREDLITQELGMPSAFSDPRKLSEAKKAAFGEYIETAGGPQARIKLSNVREILDDNLESTAAATDPLWSKIGKKGGYLNDLYQAGNEISFKDMNTLRSKIWENFNKLTLEQKALRGQLLDAFNSDLAAYEMETGNQVVSALDKAMKAAGKQRQFGSSRYLERLLDQATTFNTETMAYQFQPAIFEKAVRSNRNTLERMLSPEQMENVNAFVDKSKLAIEDIKKASVPKFSGRDATVLAAEAGAVWSQPYLAVPLAFQPIVARSLMNPSGWVRKWLTTGIKPPAMAKEAGKVAYYESEEE